MTVPVPMRVLVIDDDADTRANFADILALDEYQVETAGSAAEALSHRDWSRLAAIILDRRLPDSSAEQLLPRLRQLAPEAAVLIVTGYADLDGAIAALRQGAADYILKPINPDELRNRLRHVTARVWAEEQIRTLASIPAESPDPVLRADQKGGLLYANAASDPLLKCWGCQVGQPLPDFWRREIDRVLGSAQNREVEVECAEKIYAFVIAAIRGGEYVNIYGRDVTARRQAERELRRERDFAERLIETAQAVVLVLDIEGRVVRFNRYTESLTGHALKEVKGKDWFTTFLPPAEVPRLREVFRKTLAEADTNGAVNPILTRDNQQRELQWSNQVLRDSDGKVVGVLAIGQDITSLREAQQRALQAERLAAIGQMMTGLAHESGNALARSQACLEMLALEVQGNAEALDLIGRIQKAQDHLRQLYEEVRGYAAPVRLERDPWDVSGVWRQAWENLALRREGKDASLHEEVAGVNLECPVDPFRLEQVFRNIFDNALAACPPPVRIVVRCTEARLGDRPALCVAVRDNGPGLNAEQRRRIFEPFFTTKTKGTGLGMAIAKRIVEAHGGRLAVGTGTGPGAEIILTLPREGS
jgi:PAS domain S-box-containing protein